MSVIDGSNHVGRPGPALGVLSVAAAASLGAGAIHAAAIGVHAEHPQVVRVFTVLAILQLAWGAAALMRSHRALLITGIVINGAAFIGWGLAKTVGISAVSGLEVSEPVQWPDGLCAAFALLAMCGAAGELVRSGRPTMTARFAVVPLAAIALFSFVGMSGAATHDHHHDAGSEVQAHAGGDTHDQGDAAGDHTGGDHTGGDQTEAGTEAASAVAPVPYDPTMPIDLGGVEGVTPAQQARAENLVAVSLAELPKFADWTSLEARGYHSIQDASTGHEHFVNWDLLNDGRELDPAAPESLVFQMIAGQKTLVSAMFMAEPGKTLDNVPDIGGRLTQWHIHDNLCYAGDPPVVAGLTQFDGTCRPGTRILGDPVPMIHVWIRSHPCGPFAALEGIGAGQVKPGETAACDSAHGHQGHGSTETTAATGIGS